MKPPHSLIGILAALLLSIGSHAQSNESDYYRHDSLIPPKGTRIEVGGMDFLSDGRLVVSTRRGQVWIITNPMAENPADAQFHLAAEGLRDALGLEIVDDVVYVMQRGELTRLIDTNGDGQFNRFECVCNAWGVSGNYHEFGFGLPRDNDGNFYISLNVSFFSPKWWHGKSPVPYRGWTARISPDGQFTPVAPGFRSPCGLGRNAAGDIFITDNQGDWMPACPIYHLQEGRFYGHPASLDWTDDYTSQNKKSTDTDPPATRRAPAAVWLPYGWSRSAGNLVADDTDGKFSPFNDQLFVAELTNGVIVRTCLEKVQGEYQGAAIMFRRGIGSAVRTCFASDGTMFIGRTERGWGGQAPGDGIGRLRPIKGKSPLEMQTVHLLSDGFEITFTEPLDENCKPAIADIYLAQYDYNYWWEYGSPEQRTRPIPMTGISLSNDRLVLTVKAPTLRPARIARMRLTNIWSAEGDPLLHNEFSYTINQMPGAPRNHEHIAKLVPKPLPKEKSHENFIYLTTGNALDFWQGEGWQSGDVNWKKGQGEALTVKPNPKSEVISNTASKSPTPLATKYNFGAIDMNFDVFLPEGGEATVYAMGRYGLRLTDSRGQPKMTVADFGALAPAINWPGKAALYPAYSGPGRWYYMSFTFMPPLLNNSGAKVLNARFSRVKINDTLLHESVDIPGPSIGAPMQDEAATGPIVLIGQTNVGFRNINIRAINLPIDTNGDGEPLFDGSSLATWKQNGGAWKVSSGAIEGMGSTGLLAFPRPIAGDFELSMRCKINHPGAAALNLKGASNTTTLPIDSRSPRQARTGSIEGQHNVLTTTVPHDTWMQFKVIRKSGQLQVLVNNFVLSDIAATPEPLSLSLILRTPKTRLLARDIFLSN